MPDGWGYNKGVGGVRMRQKRQQAALTAKKHTEKSKNDRLKGRFPEDILIERHRAAFALAVQALSMGALGCFAALIGLFLGGQALSIVHGACIWPVQSILGLYLSFFCAKNGVPAILAWPIAPACFAAAYWLIVGMAPSFGAAALCALTALVGASAGEVWLRRSKNGGK